MNSNPDIDCFRRTLADFEPESNALPRCLALYSAAITIADEELLTVAIGLGRRHGVTRDQFYEIVLQSYLFLGFPRMLIAATHLYRVMPDGTRPVGHASATGAEFRSWQSDGLALCRRIYGDAFEPLRVQVESIAPEIFQWMVLEGYGKVLSRPGLDIVNRELSIVAFLMVENRSRQLFSHMRGALNVGASEDLLRTVIEDIGNSIGDGYREAHTALERLEVG